MTVATASINAQDAKKNNDNGVYLRVGVGYSFPQAGDYISGTETSTATSYSSDLKKGSYGSGFNAALAGGYMFSPNIGVELAVGAGIAPKKYTMEYTETGANAGTMTNVTYAKMPIMIMPSLVLSTGHTGVEAYTRVGLAINVAGKLINEFEAIDRSNTPDVIVTMTEEYTPKLGIGLQGALGVKYHVNDMLGIYVEANGLSMRVDMKKSEVTAFDVNGINTLGLLTINDAQTEYSANYTETSGPANPSTPHQTGPMSVPFSNLGIGVGVTLKF